jgi:hypothetical protein
MSIMPRPAFLDRMTVAITALLLAILSGCQSPSSSGLPKTVEPWRLLERVGHVRAATNADALARAVRPGDLLTEGHILSTGRGGLAILKTDGVQLTLGESTSVRLSTPDMPNIALNQGWLRVRATTAANRKARITNRHFSVHGSNTVFVIRADHDGATLSVDSGDIVLSAMNGLHRAVLAAGAGAKIGNATSHELMVRKASNEDFIKLTPLSTKESDDSAPSSMMPASGANRPADASKNAMIIRRASQRSLKKEREHLSDTASRSGARVTTESRTVPTPPAVVRALSEVTPPPLSVEPLGALPSNAPVVSSSSRIDDGVRPSSSPPDTVDELDHLQMQFDLLTEGLTDNL